MTNEPSSRHLFAVYIMCVESSEWMKFGGKAERCLMGLGTLNGLVDAAREICWNGSWSYICTSTQRE